MQPISNGQRLRQYATYDSDDRDTAREFFSADYYAERVRPSLEEMEAILRASVAISVPQFPGAEIFICNFLGIDILGPAQTGKWEDKNTEFLRIAFWLKEQLQEQVNSGFADAKCVICPLCGSETIVAYIGMMPMYDEHIGSLVPLVGPKLIGVDVQCSCTNFQTEHYTEIEEQISNSDLLE